MAQRQAGIIPQKVLFRDIGDVFRLVVFREDVVEGLVLGRPPRFRNCVIPFLGVC